MRSSTRALLELVEAGARLPTIAALTGLPRSKVRELWRMQNRIPPSGRYPSLQQLLKTCHAHIEASILAQYLQSLAGEGLSAVETIYNAYKMHRIVCPKSAIAVDHAFLLWQTLRSGESRVMECPRCAAMVLVMGKTRKCCFCRSEIFGG